MNTLLANLKMSLITANAKVAGCQIDLDQAKATLDANPNDETAKSIYSTVHQTYMDSLKAAVQIQLQINLLCNTITAKIGVSTGLLDTLTTDLTAIVKNVVNEVVSLIGTLRVQIQLKLDLYIARITDCIKAFRPTCGSITVDFLNLSANGDPTIDASVVITDTILSGEQTSDMRDSHSAILRAAFMLFCGNVNVVVDIGSVTGTACSYTVHVG